MARFSKQLSTTRSSRIVQALAVMLALAALALHPASLFAQGSLNPPGPPGPTMKSLDQIETRTPIAVLPFSIAAPGSYYLTTNLAGVSGQSGVAVSADNVTIDLNGFELAGVPGANAGIVVAGTHTNLVVRNGTIRDWPVAGVGAGLTPESRYERLRLLRNNSGALNVGNDCLVLNCIADKSPATAISTGSIAAGTGCTIRECVVKASGSFGIQTSAGCVVNRCTVEYSGGTGITVGSGSTVSGCAVNSGNAVGIAVGQNSSVLDCNTTGNTASGITAGAGSTVRNCSAGNNGGAGIVLFDAGILQDCTTRQNNNGGLVGGNASTLTACTAVSNLNNAITVGNGVTVTHCTASGSLQGIVAGNSCVLQACTVSLNSSNGVLAGDACKIQECALSNNGASGIQAGAYCLISGNTASGNAQAFGTAAGIYVTSTDNQILDNNVTFGGRGIKADTGYNLIVKNKATLNTPTNFDLAPQNRLGSITNDPAAAGPWANFSF